MLKTWNLTPSEPPEEREKKEKAEKEENINFYKVNRKGKRDKEERENRERAEREENIDFCKGKLQKQANGLRVTKAPCTKYAACQQKCISKEEKKMPTTKRATWRLLAFTQRDAQK